MAKPIQLQWLRHGKILCKAVYPFFVETWNWLVDSWNNLRGDWDADPKNGAIWVDKSDPNHPVIRLRTDNLNLGGGGSEESTPRAFDIDGRKVINCKIYCGNKLVTCSDYTISINGGDIYLKVTRGTSDYTIAVTQTFVAETSTVICYKLWEYSNGAPTLDVRPGVIPVFAL